MGDNNFCITFPLKILIIFVMQQKEFDCKIILQM